MLADRRRGRSSIRTTAGPARQRSARARPLDLGDAARGLGSRSRCGPSRSTPISVYPTPTYAWDLDGDGEFDDATSARVAPTIRGRGTFTFGLQVTDDYGAAAT